VVKSLAIDHLDRPVGGVRNKHQPAGLMYVPVVESALSQVTGNPDFAPQPQAH
jgi:hypothetical protein